MKLIKKVRKKNWKADNKLILDSLTDDQKLKLGFELYVTYSCVLNYSQTQQPKPTNMSYFLQFLKLWQLLSMVSQVVLSAFYEVVTEMSAKDVVVSLNDILYCHFI